ncbi:MAG: type II secretion system protein [Sulfuricurvum sp.]
MKRLAFSMLELVFVIVVIGILASVAIPSLSRHPLQEAAEQIATHIRYTQHLAMMNDVYNPTAPQWYYARPQISFRSCSSGGNYYYVGSDMNLNTGHIAESESAKDPLSGKNLYWLNTQCKAALYSNREQKLLLQETYGIRSVTTTCGGTISFDSFGRPYNSFSTTNPYGGQLTTACKIVLTHSDTKEGTATLSIEPITGYVSITYP